MANRDTEHLDWDRIIIHADMDAFFAAVEQLDHPEYRGLPVVIGSRHGRSVVSTASYEARVFGVHSAMPMMKALQLCPHAIVVKPNMHRYKEISRIIMAVFNDFSPLVEPLSIDEAFLDVSGSVRLLGSPMEMARRIKLMVREKTGGLIVSLGMSNTKFVAKVASDMQKPDGLTVVPPGAVRSFLHPLDISKIWGVGPVTQKKLRALGIDTMGQVAATPKEKLATHFKTAGENMWYLANGIDSRPVVLPQGAKSVGKEFTLGRDVSGLDSIWPHLVRAADEVAYTLRRKNILAKSVRVKLKTSKFKLLTRQGVLEHPADGADELLHKAKELLDKFDLGDSYRLVGLAAFDFTHQGETGDLLGAEQIKRSKQLNAALDKVKEKFGVDTIGRGSAIDKQNRL